MDPAWQRGRTWRYLSALSFWHFNSDFLCDVSTTNIFKNNEYSVESNLSMRVRYVTCYNSKTFKTWVHTKMDIPSARPFPGWSSNLVPCPPSTSPAWIVCCSRRSDVSRCLTAFMRKMSVICGKSKYVPEVNEQIVRIRVPHTISSYRHRFSVSSWPLTCHIRPQSWCCLRAQTVARGSWMAIFARQLFE